MKEEIEYIKYEETYLPSADTVQNDFNYGKSIEKLDYNIALRNKPTYTKVKLKAIQNSSLTTISYTGIGFQPTSIECNCYVSSGANANFGYGIYEGGVYNAFTYYGGGTTSPGNYIASGQSPAGFINATLDSFDDDGFTLTFTGSTPPTLNMMFKCYG